jgi:hypothetical protein
MRNHPGRSERKSPRRSLDCQPEAQKEWPRLVDTLAELYELLEQHAPMWYTYEHHERAEAALQLVKKSRTVALPVIVGAP